MRGGRRERPSPPAAAPPRRPPHLTRDRPEEKPTAPEPVRGLPGGSRRGRGAGAGGSPRARAARLTGAPRRPAWRGRAQPTASRRKGRAGRDVTRRDVRLRAGCRLPSGVVPVPCSPRGSSLSPSPAPPGRCLRPRQAPAAAPRPRPRSRSPSRGRRMPGKPVTVRGERKSARQCPGEPAGTRPPPTAACRGWRCFWKCWL